jgi:hypothetical protein
MAKYIGVYISFPKDGNFLRTDRTPLCDTQEEVEELIFKKKVEINIIDFHIFKIYPSKVHIY